ncbi:cysteine hydrolase family protein [Dyella sp. GSA-30]|uniref:cysteine hydrolase family protein n=1 Tax=Dyella sp. GSA-30 TaxID=2994496 RepID=UPI002490185F|nr:cysteine hydrolase family protein [Dyella sp. GSA-30]BDU21980.1 cysteine hydrolase [Dyella sp. GSA-30]
MKNALFASLVAMTVTGPVAAATNDHPTLRAIGGATAPTSLDARTTALLVIDFQNEYFSGKLPIPDGRKALDQARKLVGFADQHGIDVIHVRHITPAGSPVFAEGSNGAEIVDGIKPGKNHTLLTKNQVSVFASTDIDARLRAKGIKTLIISGLMTHACVAGAARDAVPLGYNVIVASDAVATRPIDAFDGKGVVSAQDLHRAALTEISDAFATVEPTGDILALPVN